MILLYSKRGEKVKKIIIICFLFGSLFFVSNVKATTLGGLKSQLNKMESDYQQNENSKALTEEQIRQTNTNITNIKASIEQLYIDMETLNKEINKLNDDIVLRDKEMKDVMSFIQVSKGESAYMEYLFGAKDFTDFIYRLVVSEEMTNYNENLINEYNQMIKDKATKNTELVNNEKELKKKQEELRVELAKLGEKLAVQTDTSLSIKEEIKSQREIIKMYENLGCNDTQDVSTCGRAVLPSGTAFYRPLDGGYVTSEWGSRWGGFHEGIDTSSGKHSTVYSVGSGVIASIIYKNSCGGNMVIGHYSVGGSTYTAVYAHLYSMNVSVGDIVNKDTQIGIMGGGAETEWYDGCTMGDHLHLTIATGRYGIDYSSWKTMTSRSINPRSVINFPTYRYDDRYTQY